MKTPYDSSWDKRDEAFDKKYQEWKKRDWMKWLEKNLVELIALKIFRLEMINDGRSIL